MNKKNAILIRNSFFYIFIFKKYYETNIFIERCSSPLIFLGIFFKQDVLDEATLHALHQELIRDKEIYTPPESFLNRDGNSCHQSVNGQYYCGQQVLDCQCCNGICGPSHGCSCKSCQQVLEECRENSGNLKSYVSAANDHIEAWSWGHTPTISELRSFSKLVAHKQLMLFKSSLESNPYLHNLKMKLYVYSRYLSVHSRLSFVKTEKENKTVMVTTGKKEETLKSR